MTSLNTFCKSILRLSGQGEVQDLTGIDPSIEAKLATGVVQDKSPMLLSR